MRRVIGRNPVTTIGRGCSAPDAPRLAHSRRLICSNSPHLFVWECHFLCHRRAPRTPGRFFRITLLPAIMSQAEPVRAAKIHDRRKSSDHTARTSRNAYRPGAPRLPWRHIGGRARSAPVDVWPPVPPATAGSRNPLLDALPPTINFQRDQASELTVFRFIDRVAAQNDAAGPRAEPRPKGAVVRRPCRLTDGLR
jgi:hypothetical protein